MVGLLLGALRQDQRLAGAAPPSTSTRGLRASPRGPGLPCGGTILLLEHGAALRVDDGHARELAEQPLRMSGTRASLAPWLGDGALLTIVVERSRDALDGHVRPRQPVRRIPPDGVFRSSMSGVMTSVLVREPAEAVLLQDVPQRELRAIRLLHG